MKTLEELDCFRFGDGGGCFFVGACVTETALELLEVMRVTDEGRVTSGGVRRCIGVLTFLRGVTVACP